MKEKNKIALVTIAVALVYLVAIIGWHLFDSRRNLEAHMPGADNRPDSLLRKSNEVVVGEYFMKYKDVPQSNLNGKWTGFRGPSRDNIVASGAKINTSDDYPLLWSVETGEGHASAAIYNGLVYFIDYDELLSSDALRCLSLETGEEIWRRWYRVPLKRNHGFSRTIPVVGDGYVITIGPEGHVMCCDPISGDMKWYLDMQKEFTTEVPFWYTGQCPLVDNETLVLAPAGVDTLLIGLNCLTGEVLWSTPNTVNFGMSHSSVMPMTLGGKKTYVYIGVGGVCGVSAEGNDIGKILWHTTAWQPSVVAPSPLQLTSSLIFLDAGYGVGGALLEVNGSGNNWSTKLLDQYKPNAGLACEQQTPILYNNMIISIIPKDGGGMRERLVCYSPNDLHNPLWTSGSDERFGLGPYLVIDNLLFVLKEDGELYVYRIERNGLEMLKRQRIMDGSDAWGPMAYADGMLILRDAQSMKCIKII